MSSTRVGDPAGTNPGTNPGSTPGGTPAAAPAPAAPSGGSSMAGRVAAAWAFVGIPLAYGVYETVKKASALF